MVITATGPELASQLNYHSDQKCKTISLCISPCIYWYRQVLSYKEMRATQPLPNQVLCTSSLLYCFVHRFLSSAQDSSPTAHLPKGVLLHISSKRDMSLPSTCLWCLSACQGPGGQQAPSVPPHKYLLRTAKPLLQFTVTHSPRLPFPNSPEDPPPPPLLLSVFLMDSLGCVE